MGSMSAQHFRQYDGRADPLVCAVGIFIAVPLTFFGLVCAQSQTGLSWFLLFLSVTALSTNWAVVSDMVLSVTVPTKRAFATAIQILISHMFGDATSPFITGAIRDEINKAHGGDYDYYAFLYSLLSTLIIQTSGAFAFLYCAKFFVQDVEACKMALAKREDNEQSSNLDAANMTDFAAIAKTND